MLDSGLWDVVGCAARNDPLTPKPWKGVPGYGLKGEGLARGRLRRFVGGACSGFTYSWYNRIIDPVELSIYWFTLMTAKYSGDPERIIPNGGTELKDSRCAHFAGYTINTFCHLDADEEVSFADSEYAEYSDWMYYFSRGLKGPRPKL